MREPLEVPYPPYPLAILGHFSADYGKKVRQYGALEEILAVKWIVSRLFAALRSA